MVQEEGMILRSPYWCPIRLETEEWELCFPGGLRIRFGPDGSALRDVDTGSVRTSSGPSEFSRSRPAGA